MSGDGRPPKPIADSREARLAKALRDNLRRRKAAAAPASAPNQQKPAPDDP